jgi:hypothetical protein
MEKTEVYRWRLSPHLKSELEERARAERKSLAELLEEIAQEWLLRGRAGGGDEAERQQRLRESALPFVGAIEGRRPDRAESGGTEMRSR